MNIVLSDVSETTIVLSDDPNVGLVQEKRKMDMIFVRGDGVILVSPIS